MSSFLIKPAFSIKGEIHLPADKSISHRAVIISSISKGRTTIKNFSSSKDCYYTIEALKKLGIKIIRRGSSLFVYGKGIRGLKGYKKPIFVGDSGTTLRLLLGVLAGQKFSTTLTAGKFLSRRPMKRVTQPLRMMGAKIWPRAILRQAQDTSPKDTERIRSESQEQKVGEEYPPITIYGGDLKAITYKLPVASAQVKSAILLAGLYAKGRNKVIEPIPTRDHTERMLELFGAALKVKGKGKEIIIKGKQQLISPAHIDIPGDISSASFFIVAALIVKNSSLIIRFVNLNPRRIGLIKVLKRMGGDIKVAIQEPRSKNQEPVGDIIVKTSQLKGTKIKRREIPSLIDELPILMVAACFAKGKTIIESVEELRVKETDRVSSMVEGLLKLGAKIKVIRQNNQENIIITGVKHLIGARVSSFGDHRTAMSLIIAGLKAKNTLIDDVTCINKSFPTFLETLDRVIQ